MYHQSSKRVRKCAQPIELLHTEKAERAVVCLHGYTDYPGELALPSQQLFAAGFDVFVPRYPGHGTDAEDFLSTDRKDWIGEAEKSLIAAKGNYRDVYLIGQSMGGAIAVVLAERYSIAKAVLYAPALSIPSLPFTLMTLISPFVKRRAQPWQSDTRYPFFDDRDPDDDAYLGKEYWSWMYPKQLRQLGLIQREALAVLPACSTDILVLTGAKDTVVDEEAGKLVLAYGTGKNNWVHMPEATHLIPYDIDAKTRDEAMQRTVSWLNQ